MNNKIPAQELSNLHLVVAEESFAGHCVLKCGVSGVCGGKAAGVGESEENDLFWGGKVGWEVLGDLTEVPVLCPHPLVLSDTQILGKQQQSARLASSALENQRF